MADAKRASDGERVHLRLAQSIRLPFWVSVFAFLVAALAAAAFLGRPESGVTIPPAVMRYQSALATEMAQNVRRGLNEGVADLNQAASAIDAGRASGVERFDIFTETLLESHERYEKVAILDPDGAVVFGDRDGGGRLEARDGSSGIAPLAQLGKPPRPLVEQYAPLADAGLIVARYNPEFLRLSLSAAGTGDAWLVDRRGRILSSTAGYLPYAALPSDSLRDGALNASRGSAGASLSSAGLRESVIAWAPVNGEGPGGQLGMSVITSREVGSLSLPATDARREGLVVSVLIAIFTVLIFSWVWIVVMIPALRLRDEAERVARGDFGSPVEIIRYDEIGLISRATDRLRILLVGARVAGSPASRVLPQRRLLHRAAVAVLTLVALAAFTVLLVEITRVDGKARVAEAPRPTSTISTLAPAGEPSTPQVGLEAISCSQRGEAVEYSAKLSHAEPTPVRARLEVTFHDGAGAEFGRSETTVSVPPGEGLRVALSTFAPTDLRDSGATCSVTALEPSVEE